MIQVAIVSVWFATPAKVMFPTRVVSGVPPVGSATTSPAIVATIWPVRLVR